MIVRWGLDELEPLLAELSIERPFLVASPRWDDSGLPAAARWSEIPSHRIAVPGDVDGILAAGGGSAIDTAKAASAASGLQLVSVPTTYSGAEWTDYFGVRDPGQAHGGRRLGSTPRRHRLRARADPRPAPPGVGRHGDERARPLRRGALPRRSRGGAARGGAHRRVAAARARGPPRPGGAHAPARGSRRRGRGARDARPIPRPRDGAGDRRRVRAAPRCAERHLPARCDALQRRRRAPRARRRARWRRPRSSRALRASRASAISACPRHDLPALAAATAARPGARANPRPASPAEIEELLRSVW